MTQTYSRPLGAFLPNIETARAQLLATGLQLDSRQVKPGDVFFALAAEPMRSRHIEQALVQGAGWIAVDAAEPLPQLAAEQLIALPEPKRHLAQWAASFYADPSSMLSLIGITGTNGKSTTAFLLAQLLEAVSGAKGGVVGTLGFGHWRAPLEDTGKTTPDAINLQRVLHELVSNNVTQVAMEVSSHALDQGRVEHVQFAAAIFTNLTRDHLDYHGDMASYAQAKQRLFAWLELPLAVINAEDEYAGVMQAALAPTTRLLTYGIDIQADVRAVNCNYSEQGVSFDCVTPWGCVNIQSPLLGRFNLANLLASIATLLGLFPAAWPQVARLCASVQPVTGRMHLIPSPANCPKVVVDYAHTPDALEKALAALRVHASGAIWVVFGCGGDRDKGKRPLMAKAAEAAADHVILTSDNPRTEDPENILRDIRAGLTRAPWLQTTDRIAAIATTIAAAKPGDWVLIAGKGHETYQIIGEQILPLSDIEQATAALAMYPSTESAAT